MDMNGDLEDYFRERERDDMYSGVVRIVRGEQELFRGAYGYASRSWRIPNTLDMRFNTASITKLFTSVAVLQLIDRGLLGFDTRAVPFLELRDTAISEDVNIFHLLTHTSGIGDDADEDVLQEFIGHSELRPLKAKNAEQLTNYIRWVSTAVLQAASSPGTQSPDAIAPGLNVPIPKPADPGPSDADDVW